MKPFRIYQVVAGGLEKIRSRIRHDYDTLEEAEKHLNYLLSTKWKYGDYTDTQWVIQEYYSTYHAIIVKIVNANDASK